MSERDELATTILAYFHPSPHAGESWRLDPTSAADAILAAGYRKPRTITTVEELDALGLGSVLLDSDSEAVQRIDDETMDGRSLWETELGLVTSGLVMLPATVLWEPLP